MALSQEAINEFKDIYHDEFGERITDAEAQEMGESLLELFRIIYRPIPSATEEDGPGRPEIPESP